MMSQYLWNLAEAIARMHDCSVSHSGTSRVIEMAGDETVFDGDVETFAVTGHVFATKVFGWAWKDKGGETQYVGVLNVPPIDGPREAVQAVIASRRLQ